MRCKRVSARMTKQCLVSFVPIQGRACMAKSAVTSAMVD
jgi:hypothetical protein